MMPLMNYIHEQENYSLSVHVYPANENQETSFELYEDDGESLGYQKDVYAKTKFSCIAKVKSVELKIAARQENGYTPPKNRNIIFKLHADRKPAAVVNGKTKLLFSATADFVKNSEKDYTGLQWSWDEKAGVCMVKVPDKGRATVLWVLKGRE